MSPTPSTKQVVAILLHGDVDIFNKHYLASGTLGGRSAAEDLHDTVVAHLASRGIDGVGCEILCYVFCNKLPMGIYVVRSKLVDDSHTFELFVKGFNSSSFPFIYVDTGGKKNHLQAKLQQFLSIYISTEAIILLGGLSSPATAQYLAQQTPEVLSKITLVRTSKERAIEFDNLRVFATTSDFLHLFKGSNKNGKFMSNGTNGSTSTFLSLNTSSTPLPHACNDFYLRGDCPEGSECQYSHNYVFTADELASLPEKCRRIPCSLLKRGETCVWSEENCIYGHRCLYTKEECPHGRKCRFIKAGLGHEDD